MPNPDRSITVFSSDGQLLQVQYALEAVKLGSPVVGVRGTDTIVIATEKRSVSPLQVGRVEQKMSSLDSHVMLAFAGLRADARVLIGRARIECQSHRLSLDEPVTVEYITRYIAGMQQFYTQTHGRRPFGVSCVIGGFDPDGDPHLFQTEPSGIFYEWKATATGRNDRMIRTFLEKNYSPSVVSSEDGCIRLALRALLEEAGRNSKGKDYDVAVIKRGQSISKLPKTEVATFVQIIQKNTKAPNFNSTETASTENKLAPKSTK